MQSLETTKSRRPMNLTAHHPCCMIVEDEVLIALMIEDCLEESGYAPAGPFRSGSEALAWLMSNTPQAAVLDYSLSDGACATLAAELERRGIPFLVHSAHRPDADVPPVFLGAPWVDKPSTRTDLLDALGRIVEPGTRS
jgi:DNA-binding response OmpR family regulator